MANKLPCIIASLYPQDLPVSLSEPSSSCLELLPVYRSTPLHLAAALGFASAVHVLLRDGHARGLRVPDSLSNVPLHAAVASGDVTVVKMVLARTVKLRSQDVRRVLDEAADVAVILGDVEVVATLMRYGGRLVNWSRVSLRSAVASANLPLVRLLVQEGGARLQNDDSWFRMENNPLHLAAYTYRRRTPEEVGVVQCLLQHGADPNRLCFLGDRHGVSGAALHFALMARGDVDGSRQSPVPEIVEALLRAGADPNQPNALGEPPLLRLKPGRCCGSLQLLLNYGADPALTDHHDDTYLTSTTFRCGDSEEHAVQFARVLLDSGACVNARGRKGLTALHRAIREPKLFWFLLCRGADPEVITDGGRNVLAHLLNSTSDRNCLGKVCLTLFMCAKGGVSFTRPSERSSSLILRYKETTTSLTPALDSRALRIQVVMLRMLYEVGYLTPNDRLEYFVKELGSRLPDGVLDNVSDLCNCPPPLLSLCRRAALVSFRHHGTRRDQAVSSMVQIPDLVKKYLQFSDLTKMVSDALGWSEEQVLSYFLPQPTG